MTVNTSLFRNLFRYKKQASSQDRRKRRRRFSERLESRQLLTTILFDNDFDSPDNWVPRAGVFDVDTIGPNIVYGSQGTFGGVPSVDSIWIDGPNNTYSDPSGTGGDYSLGLLEGITTGGFGGRESVTLTFSPGGNNFVNAGFDISPSSLSFNGSTAAYAGSVTTPMMQVSVWDEAGFAPGNYQTNSTGTLLDQVVVAGNAPLSPQSSELLVSNWSSHVTALDVSTASGANVILEFDLVDGGYGALDNLIVAASNTAGDLGNAPPEINDQSFSVDENSDNATVVGTAVATDPDLPGDTLTWTITEGNTGGAFAINPSSGEITVADKSSLDFETTPDFDLTVQVEDAAGATDDATITVNLNDLEATLSIDDASVIEGDAGPATLAFTVSVSGDAINVPFDVNYNSTDGTAVSMVSGAGSNDYDATSGTANFSGASGSETQPITITVNGDAVVELDETMSLVLSAVTGTNDVSIADGNGEGTIENDDSTAISVGDATVVEGGDLDFAVTLSNPVDVDTAITYSTNADTATTADNDYTGQTLQTIMILAGDTSGTITVATTADNKVELDETLTIGVDSFDMDGRSGTLAVTGVLFENDFDSPTSWTPRVGVFDVDTIGPNVVYSGQGAFDGIPSVDSIWIDGSNGTYSDPSGIGGEYFLGLLEGPTTGGFGGRETVTLTFSPGGSGYLNASFDLSPSSLSFNGTTAAYAGSVTAPVMQVSVWDESGFDEGDAFTDSSGTLLDQVVVTGNAPLTPQSSELLISNWSSHIAGLDVSSASGGNVVLEFDLIGGRYGALDNLLIAASSSPGVFNSGGGGTILNDDSATLSIDDVGQSETDGATTLTFDVSLSAPVDTSVLAAVDTTDGTAVAGSNDYQAINGGSVNIAAGATAATIDVTVNGDEVVELDEQFFVNLSDLLANGRAVTFADNTGEGTIENDDFAPVAHAGGLYSIDEGDGLTLDGSATTDGDSVSLTYRWDVDGDGDFDEGVTGATPSITAAAMATLGLTDGPDTRSITVEASDGTNVDTATTSLTINNVDPTGTDDVASTDEDAAVIIAVLDNDTDPAGIFDPLMITGVSGGTPGTVVTTDGSAITYDPNGEFDYLSAGDSATDTLTYDVTDGDGGVSSAMVTVTISGTNDGPVLDSLTLEAVIDDTDKDETGDRRTVDLVATGADGIVGQNLVLTGTFTDVELSDAHTVTVNWDDGTVETFSVTEVNLNDDGRSFELNHTYSATGAYSISVTIDDGTATDSGLVGVGVAETANQDGILAIAGTSDDDEITVRRRPGGELKVIVRQRYGGVESFTASLDDVDELLILGLGGDDYIAVSHALSLPTVLNGGDGHDAVVGGRGNDTIIGGEGDDLLIGRAGDDVVLGGAGHDFLKGNHGNDCLDGGEGNDAIAGGNGADTATGGDGYDVILGQNHDDLIYGNDQNDWLYGGNCDDVIFGGDGDDAIWGGNGNDELFGEAGNDWIHGGNGADLLVGDDGQDMLFGGNGADIIDGGDGNDLISGGNGADTINGGAGDDLIFGGRGNDNIDGGTGNDWIFDRWRWVWC